MKGILNMSSKVWTKTEEQYLQKHFSTEDKDKIAKKLNRTWTSIKRKANKLGLKRQNRGTGSTWLKTDIQYLKSNYAVLPKEDLMQCLGRTWLSVQNKAHKLNLIRPDFHQREWTKEEDNILRQLYPKGSQEEILQKLDWSWDAICRRAEKIKVQRDLSYIHSVRERDDTYSEEEIEYLQQNFEKGLKEDIVEHLNRCWGTIATYARRVLRLERDRDLAYSNRINPCEWDEGDIDILKKEYKNENTNIELISKQLGKTRRSVTNKARKLGIKKEKYFVSSQWTEEEIETIKKHYPDGDALDILKMLPRRTWAAVKAQACILNLKRNTVVLHSERRMKRLLDEIYPDEQYQDNIKPKWLKNPDTGKLLELDRYYPNLNLAFEYNGLQHYELCFGDDEQREQNRLAIQQQRDEVKQQLCDKRGVTLIVVTCDDFLTIEHLERLIAKHTNNAPVDNGKQKFLAEMMEMYKDLSLVTDEHLT